MIEDIYTYGQFILAGIGVFSVLLKTIAPFTKNKKDDEAVKHIEWFLKTFSLHQDEEKLSIIIKKK